MRSAPRLAIAAVLAVAAALLLSGLGDAPLRPYDEGLYARLAHDARLHQVWLHAVEADGTFSTSFSKPPLSLWITAASFRWLGVSMTALRLPFAIGMLAAIAVCIGWGTRTRGPGFGIAWGAVLTLCAATLRWGRVACIEPIFVAFVLLALWSHAEAVAAPGRRADRWSLLGGAALTLAFFTKQLAVGLAVAPILAAEVWLRREAGAGRTRRLAIVLGTPALFGGAWLVGTHRRVGDALWDTFFVGSVARRIAGFDSGHNARALNEVADVVGDATAPFSWALGLGGLLVALWLRSRPVATLGPPDRLRATLPSLFALVVSATLLYDNVARTVLPWYAFAFVPPVAAGIAVLIEAAGRGPSPSPGPPAGAIAPAAGVIALGLALVASTRSWVSQLDAALVVLAVVGLWVWRTPLGARAPRWIAAALGVVALGTLRSPVLHTDAGGLEILMETVGARDLERIDVHRNTGAGAEIEYAAYFGPGARSVRSPPWHRRDPPPQAYVTANVPPRQLVPPPGVELLRGPGAVAWVAESGTIEGPLWTVDTTRALLDAGPIDFEAEDQAGDVAGTLCDDEAASGGRARARVPFMGERLEQAVLTNGPRWSLPAANYEAAFIVRPVCPAPDAEVGWVAVFADGRELVKRAIGCSDGEPGAYRPIALGFRLIRDSRVDLRVVAVRGELWHDRTSVRRVGD